MNALEFYFVRFVSLSKSNIQWNEKCICIKQYSKFKMFSTEGEGGFYEQKIWNSSWEYENTYDF